MARLQAIGPTLRIEPVRDKQALNRFIAMPTALYHDDPNWVPPLLMERREHLDPAKNPFFAHAQVAFWLARRGEHCVGRISAQVNYAHLERHRDNAGHFGFLEAEDDPNVFAALLGTAEAWLAKRGMTRVLGPFSLSINDECGLLIDGFERPPFLMMGHARPYYAGQLEALGYRKAKDLLCYLYDLRAPMPAPMARALKRLGQEPGLRFRPLNMQHLPDDVRVVMGVFNDAWSDNWGFVPLSEAELATLAQNLRLLIRPGFVAIAEIDGAPAAVGVSLPNLNEAIADLGGRLLPFGWAKLLWRLKVRGVKSSRMLLLGVARRHQASALGMALALGVIDRIRVEHVRRGVEVAELSWVLEDNRPVRRIIEMLGARRDKIYRIYEKPLT
ncbi:MAG: dATP pyrophosphohydrolase [Rhodoplanes sp.]